MNIERKKAVFDPPCVSGQGADVTTNPGPPRGGDLLTFEQAAAWLGLDKTEAVRWLCRTRKVRHVKIGKRVMIRRAWLEEFLQRDSVAPISLGNDLTRVVSVVESGAL